DSERNGAVAGGGARGRGAGAHHARRSCQRDLIRGVTAGMPCFTYAAIDASKGREQRGRIDGEDVATAIAAITARGLHPVEVRRLNECRERSRPGARCDGFAKRLRGSMTLRERMLFIRQLASLVRAGLPLLRSLEVLSRQRMGGRMTDVADMLAEAI